MGRLDQATRQGSTPATHTPLCLWSFASSSASSTKSAAAGDLARAFGFLLPLVISYVPCHSCHCSALSLSPAPDPTTVPTVRCSPASPCLSATLPSLSSQAGHPEGDLPLEGWLSPAQGPPEPQTCPQSGAVLLHGHSVPAMGNAEWEPQLLVPVQLDVSICPHCPGHQVPPGCPQHSPHSEWHWPGPRTEGPSNPSDNK